MVLCMLLGLAISGGLTYGLLMDDKYRSGINERNNVADIVSLLCLWPFSAVGGCLLISDARFLRMLSDAKVMELRCHATMLCWHCIYIVCIVAMAELGITTYVILTRGRRAQRRDVAIAIASPCFALLLWMYLDYTTVLHWREYHEVIVRLTQLFAYVRGHSATVLAPASLVAAVAAGVGIVGFILQRCKAGLTTSAPRPAPAVRVRSFRIDR